MYVENNINALKREVMRVLKTPVYADKLDQLYNGKFTNREMLINILSVLTEMNNNTKTTLDNLRQLLTVVEMNISNQSIPKLSDHILLR